MSQSFDNCQASSEDFSGSLFFIQLNWWLIICYICPFLNFLSLFTIFKREFCFLNMLVPLEPGIWLSCMCVIPFKRTGFRLAGDAEPLDLLWYSTYTRAFPALPLALDSHFRISDLCLEEELLWGQMGGRQIHWVTLIGLGRILSQLHCDLNFFPIFPSLLFRDHTCMSENSPHLFLLSLSFIGISYF